jgi:hypothetical protein
MGYYCRGDVDRLLKEMKREIQVNYQQWFDEKSQKLERAYEEKLAAAIIACEEKFNKQLEEVVQNITKEASGQVGDVTTSLAEKIKKALAKGSGKDGKKQNDLLRAVQVANVAQNIEKESRANNIIIWGLEESSHSSATEVERHDKGMMERLCIELLPEKDIFGGSGADEALRNIVKMRRLSKGKNNKGPAPLLVTFKSGTISRRRLMERCNRLKVTETKGLTNVYINEDYTLVERDLAFNLRRERDVLNDKLKKTDKFRYVVIGLRLVKREMG